MKHTMLKLSTLIICWSNQHFLATAVLQLPCKSAGGHLPMNIWGKLTDIYWLGCGNKWRRVHATPSSTTLSCKKKSIVRSVTLLSITECSQPPLPADPRAHLHASAWRKHGWCWWWRGEQQMAGLPPSCLVWGEQCISQSSYWGGEGDFTPQTAGRQRASHPPLSLHVHTDTHSAINRHGPWLNYLPGTCKQ